MSESQPKLKFEEDKERTATRSPPKKSKVEQSVPKKKKLKLDADKAAEKSQHLRFGKAEITPDEASRMTKQKKRAMYVAAAARSAVHREVDQYEDDNVGTQALNEGLKSEEAVSDFSKNRYARKLKKKAKLQAKKNAPARKFSISSSDKAKSAEDSSKAASTEGGSNWFSRWRQKQDIQKSYRAAARSGGTAAQTVGGQKAASGGTSAAKSGMEQVMDKGKSVVSTAVNGIADFAKGNAHVFWIVGVFLLLLLLVMSAFSSCSILFSGTTQVSGQTIYTAEDRDIKGAETDYKKLEKDLDKKIKRTPQDHPGYDEYQYHLDNIEHDPWQLTSFLTTLYDDYTRSEVQAKLKEIFAKQYKLTTWVEVQTRYRTVVMIDPFILILGAPIAWLMNALNAALAYLSGNTSTAILLGLVLGAMVAVDMGGPVNKVAFLFGTAEIAAGHPEVMGAVAAAIPVPPLAVGLATFLARDLFEEEEKASGLSAFLMGLIGITEGAIPFASADPKHILPSIIIGSGVAGALASVFGITDVVPHGGPIVGVLGATNNLLLFLVCIAIGTVVAAALILFFRKKTHKVH